MWGNSEENIFNPFKKATKSKPETISQDELRNVRRMWTFLSNGIYT